VQPAFNLQDNRDFAFLRAEVEPLLPTLSSNKNSPGNRVSIPAAGLTHVSVSHCRSADKLVIAQGFRSARMEVVFES
jgi:hypothetical protein